MATSIAVEFLVQGAPLIVDSFAAVSGTYGSVGHMTAKTSRKQLAASGISLIGLSTQQPQGVELVINATIDGAKSRLFGGEYVTGDWNYDADEVTISARDYAGVLVDQKRVLVATAEELNSALAPGQSSSAAGILTQNQSVGQLVTQIAQQFGLTPVLNLPTGDNPEIGTIYSEQTPDTVFLSIPQSLWAVLNMIARDTGNEVYVTPNKELVFGTPGAGATPLLLTYGQNQGPPGSMPVRGLKVVHNPRRNASFRVVVNSYNPATAQLTQGKAYVLGTTLTLSDNVEIQSGVWSGLNTAMIDDALIGQNKQMPLYTFYVDGLTQDQANARALAIATDISKRELIMSGILDPVPGIVPTNPLTIQGAIDPEFAGETYYVNSYTHRFVMPRAENSYEGGLVTDFAALSLPLEGQGSAVVKKAKLR